MGLLSNPEKLTEMMADPEVGPVLQKLMSKMMPGGAMPGMNSGAMDSDDIPNLDDLNGDIDISDLPDLETP